MPDITFHGGKWNNRKRFVKDLQPYIYCQYAKKLEIDSPMVYFETVTDVYKLVKVSKMVDNKNVTRIGYMKEGSKTKPDTIWNKGLFHSERVWVQAGASGYWQ